MFSTGDDDEEMDDDALLAQLEMMDADGNIRKEPKKSPEQRFAELQIEIESEVANCKRYMEQGNKDKAREHLRKKKELEAELSQLKAKNPRLGEETKEP